MGQGHKPALSFRIIPKYVFFINLTCYISKVNYIENKNSAKFRELFFLNQTPQLARVKERTLKVAFPLFDCCVIVAEETEPHLDSLCTG